MRRSFAPTKVQGLLWRIAMAVVLVAFLICLIGCAMRALAATSRPFRFEEPGWERVQVRAGMKPADASIVLAADLLRASSVAQEIADMKVLLMQMSAWWLRWALMSLALLAGVLGAYAISNPTGGSDTTAGASSATVSRTAP